MTTVSAHTTEKSQTTRTPQQTRQATAPQQQLAEGEWSSASASASLFAKASNSKLEQQNRDQYNAPGVRST